jgi:hypothetical protein
MKKNTMKVTNRLWDAQPGASHYYFHDGNRGADKQWVNREKQWKDNRLKET